ncbi:MAG: S9 family peptidase [Bacteroidetes bacterium]|nr:S9 family peptidase [Bacteroidota bacterium]
MNNIFFTGTIICSTFFLFSCNSTKETSVQGPGAVIYPETKKVDSVNNYFGTLIKDPYRWMENESDPAVRTWIEEENKVTFDYLDKIPFRNAVKERLTELNDYPKMSTPYRSGKYYFYDKNDGLQNQSVTYYKIGMDGEEKIFIDPNTLSADGTVTSSIAGFSTDRKYAVISQSAAGSDWSAMYVRDLETNTQLEDKIEWTKFSGAAWYQNGFFYSAFDKPDPNETYTAASESQKVYYHNLGTPQSSDKLIYQDKINPRIYNSVQTTHDEKFLFIIQSAGTSGTGILWKYLDDKAGNLKTLFAGYDWEYNILDNEGDMLLVMTNYNAPNYKVVLVDPKNPTPENWKEIIPERKELLESVSTAGGKLFATYLKDVSSVVYQYSRSGKLENEIAMPGLGTVNGFSGEKEDTELYYSYTSFTTPADIYKYDIASGKSSLFKKSEVKFDASQYETKQVFYPSKDGTKIPMFLTYKKGITLDGNNPCFLYSYGGFNIARKPEFNTTNAALLEQGYVYAVANLRGGSEYGEEWHKAGMLDKKQNVFDDFIAAAEYLISEKYTSSNKLAIYGRSNGGLLVGAVMAQRPELFAVALPRVGVMDMLRYHTFTVGWGWAVEFGSSEDESQFNYLIKYSPLHNIKPDTKYPATLITTGDHDDRVVPAHSFKFAVTLQAAQAGDKPVLIRIDVQAGHGGGKPLTKIIDEEADLISFTMWNMGITKFIKSTE